MDVTIVDSNEIENKKRVAIATGLLQKDITIKTLLESITEGAVLVNAEGTIVSISTGEDDIFKKDDEIYDLDINHVLPNRTNRDKTINVQNYIMDPQINPHEKTLKLTLLTKDKKELEVEARFVSSKTQVETLGTAFIKAISDRVKLEDELLDRIDELKTYAYSAAHEINDMLNRITWYSDILITDKNEINEQDKDKYTRNIFHTSQKVSSIVKELLLLATLDKEEILFEEIDMKSVVQEAIKRLSFTISEYNAEVKVEDTFSNSIGYGPWVEEIWFNFIANSLKYGGMPPIIEIGSSIESDGYVKYWIKDNGGSLSLEDRENFFRPTAKAGMISVKGYGLGLSIIRRLIEKLNGHLKVESNEKNQSVFCFFLPNISAKK